jgi:cell division protein FtsI (penicillin-binding protein 3)
VRPGGACGLHPGGGNDFFQRQGEVRFARTLELAGQPRPHSGSQRLILASSVPAPSIWAIPEDVEIDKPKLKQLAKLLEMPRRAERKKLRADEDKTFVWLKRQVDESVGQQIAALGIKGIYQRKEYKREYPEGEAAAMWWASPMWRTRARKAWNWPSTKSWPGASRLAPRHQGPPGPRGRRRGEQVPPVDGDMQLSIDSKVQFFAYQKLRDAVLEHKAKAGSVVVLDATPARCWRWPTTPAMSPDKRQNLTGEQLRNRALTDTFEPGSTMKPFTIGLALEKGASSPRP